MELAVTAEERARGLMGRASLDNDEGMLFIFPGETSPGFWMQGMLISLDLIWIDSRLNVVGVTANVPPHSGSGSPPTYHPPQPVLYVLEVAAGVTGELGIVPGSLVELVGISQDNVS